MDESSEQRNFVNREKRFEVDHMLGFDAIVHRAGATDGQFYADLIDFSRTGMKLNVPFCARFNEVLVLKLEFSESEFEYEGKCRVRHMRSLDDNQWQVGCSIDPPLPLDVIDYLAASSNQERRQFSRYNLEGSGLVRREGVFEGVEAVLTNLSQGGFCLETESSLDIGEKIDFVFEDFDGETQSIGAKVRWNDDQNTTVIYGCSFLNSESFDMLVDAFDVAMDDAADDFTQPFPWKIAVAAGIALILPTLSWFFLGPNSGKQTMTSSAGDLTALAVTRKAERSTDWSEKLATETDSARETDRTTAHSTVAMTPVTQQPNPTQLAAKESRLPGASDAMTATTKPGNVPSDITTAPNDQDTHPKSTAVVSGSDSTVSGPANGNSETTRVVSRAAELPTSRRSGSYTGNVVFPGVSKSLPSDTSKQNSTESKIPDGNQSQVAESGNSQTTNHLPAVYAP